MTQGWKLPDGTPCGRESYSRSLSSSSANRFCVNGECRPFDCDGINNDKSPTEACPLPFSGKLEFQQLVRDRNLIDFPLSPFLSIS